MTRLLSIAFIILACVASNARADGFKIARSGRFVPEREQRALIEWKDGVESLYVAALSDPTSESSVWIVPVRAEATAVQAEPVDELPVVAYYESLRQRTRKRLDDWVAITASLDSGGLFCPLTIGGCEEKKASAAKEVSRVEKLGMVVTVVTGATRESLATYLDAQRINRSGTNLASLEAYFNKQHAFVCGWVASEGKPVTATGLRIQFPSPNIWFPLRPTQAYSHPVETVVFVRGFVRPTDGCDLPLLQCDYIYGAVESKGVAQSFAKARTYDRDQHYALSYLEPMTRVTLTTDPQQWNQDLELDQGTTTIGYANLAINGRLGNSAMLWSSILGALIGLLIPRFTIRRKDRIPGDYALGALAGAAIVLSLWASIFAFSVWRWARFRDGPRRPLTYFAIPILAILHFGIVFVVCLGLMKWVAND